ncbi:hypothetical protein QJ856_gp0628 [Tupanvirus deep ocean]|uniref:Uncharacterized protein n=2 Tax=Tupanvirus TaxID=2094720 RepID=A0AC62A8P4_9VIRU|nr:hypothetical protein QJ856_gp0628 [Tupanvirus deep ocean]QKU34119.1 hypothetical protein [Tupanvirus deep ocean]
MHILKIKILDSCPNKEFVTEFYKNKVSNERNHGVDLIFPDDELFLTNQVIKCGMGISCEFIPDGQTELGTFELVPTTSIADTPLMLINYICIFDPGYQEEIVAAFRCFIDRNHKSTVDDFKFSIEKGTSLVRIVAPDRKPIRLELVDESSTTDCNVDNSSTMDCNVNGFDSSQ